MDSPSVSPIELDVSRIRGLSERGRHHEALVAAEALALAAPKNRDLLYLVAVNQRCLNCIYEALGTLRRLEQLHPRFSLLYQERGYCYTTLRDAPRAIEAFLRGVDINPALAKSWSMLERLFRMTGDARNAAAAAERLSSLNRLPNPKSCAPGVCSRIAIGRRPSRSFEHICLRLPMMSKRCGYWAEPSISATCSMKQSRYSKLLWTSNQIILLPDWTMSAS